MKMPLYSTRTRGTMVQTVPHGHWLSLRLLQITSSSHFSNGKSTSLGKYKESIQSRGILTCQEIWCRSVIQECGSKRLKALHTIRSDSKEPRAPVPTLPPPSPFLPLSSGSMWTPPKSQSDISAIQTDTQPDVFLASLCADHKTSDHKSPDPKILF